MDTSNFFHNMGLLRCIRHLFGLPVIQRAHKVWGPQIHSRRLRPRMRTLPMGFAWAVFFAQRILELAVSRAGLSDSRRLQDFTPPPRFVKEEVPSVEPKISNCSYIEYVDTFITLDVRGDNASAATLAVARELRRMGLPVHGLELDLVDFSFLGWVLLGGCGFVVPSSNRRWTLRFALTALLSRRAVPGWLLEIVLSQFSFCGLLRRPSLSAMGAVYALIGAHCLDAQPLWKNVRKELEWMRGLLPLLEKNLRSKWAHETVVFDASEWGAGASVKRCPLEVIREAGRYSERWRYKLKPVSPSLDPHFLNLRMRAFSSAREAAIDQAFDGHLSRSALGGVLDEGDRTLERDEKFPEVS